MWGSWMELCLKLNLSVDMVSLLCSCIFLTCFFFLTFYFALEYSQLTISDVTFSGGQQRDSVIYKHLYILHHIPLIQAAT